MDIRSIDKNNNLKINVISKIGEDKILSYLYDLNRVQLKEYQKIEPIPDYPFTVHKDSHQGILKDFIARVTEEIMEGWESWLNVFNLLEKKGFNVNVIEDSEWQEINNNQTNANEEQADAIGFFLSLLDFSNIGPEELLSYKGCDSLQDIMESGYDLLSEEVDFFIEANKTHSHEIFDGGLQYAPGFNFYGNSRKEVNERSILYIVYNLNITRNLLKNRPWKRTQVMTKESEYQEALVKSFYMYMGFLLMNDFTDKDIAGLFALKQKLNLWRISTNY